MNLFEPYWVGRNAGSQDIPILQDGTRIIPGILPKIKAIKWRLANPTSSSAAKSLDGWRNNPVRLNSLIGAVHF
jgi:hypothetical protein